MSILDKLGYSSTLYKEPERLTPAEARLRTLQNRFERLTAERRRLEAERVGLSQVNKSHLNNLKEFENKFADELEARRSRVAELQRNPSMLRSAAYKSAMSGFLKLQQRRSALLQRAAAERRANQFKASAADGRSFQFVPKSQRNARTVFGTEAFSRLSLDEVTRRLFRNPGIAIPCIQRVVRREVLFAKKQNRGHRSRHRKNVFSHIGC